jgi:hypothetical protein
VENAPLATVEQWWANEQVVIAAERRDVAYRSRDQAIWAVDRLHHEDEARERYCSCGKRTDQCKELDAIATVREALIKWENNQVDRLNRDLPHGLPDDHPELFKYKGYSHRYWHRPAG